MEWSIKCAYLPVFYGALCALLLAMVYRWNYRKQPFYTYPLTQLLVNEGCVIQFPYKKIVYGLRLVILVGLAILMARPQLVDQLSKVNVEGIDIMLVIDVSGSMQLFDSLQDQRRRIDVAKQEAIAFIKKRENDPVGVVLFGNEAISRCPLTLDKKMLAHIIEEYELGMINPEGTMIIRGLVMALNRMRKSDAKSKIIILLTDGEPTPGDLDMRVALQMAEKQHVKIYTIGIGSDQGGFYEHPLFGVQQARVPLNKNLLHTLASATGGKFFQAKDPATLASIYNTIDQLEKTSYETNVYHKYYDIFMPFLFALVALFLIECFLARWLWRGIGV